MTSIEIAIVGREITLENQKKKQRTDIQNNAKKIKSNNFQLAIEKNPILLSQY